MLIQYKSLFRKYAPVVSGILLLLSAGYLLVDAVLFQTKATESAKADLRDLQEVVLQSFRTELRAREATFDFFDASTLSSRMKQLSQSHVQTDGLPVETSAFLAELGVTARFIRDLAKFDELVIVTASGKLLYSSLATSYQPFELLSTAGFETYSKLYSQAKDVTSTSTLGFFETSRTSAGLPVSDFYLVKPIFSSQKPTNFIFGRVASSVLSSLLQSKLISTLPYETALIDLKSKTILAASQESLLLSQTAQLAPTSSFAEMSTLPLRAAEPDGMLSVVQSLRLFNTEYFCSTGVKTAILSQKTQDYLIARIPLGVGVYVVGLCISLLGLYRFSERVRVLSASVQQVVSSYQLTELPVHFSNDDLGKLAADFNNFVHIVRSQTEELQANVTQVEMLFGASAQTNAQNSEANAAVSAALLTLQQVLPEMSFDSFRGLILDVEKDNTRDYIKSDFLTLRPFFDAVAVLKALLSKLNTRLGRLKSTDLAFASHQVEDLFVRLEASFENFRELAEDAQFSEETILPKLISILQSSNQHSKLLLAEQSRVSSLVQSTATDLDVNQQTLRSSLEKFRVHVSQLNVHLMNAAIHLTKLCPAETLAAAPPAAKKLHQALASIRTTSQAVAAEILVAESACDATKECFVAVQALADSTTQKAAVLSARLDEDLAAISVVVSDQIDSAASKRLLSELGVLRESSDALLHWLHSNYLTADQLLSTEGAIEEIDELQYLLENPIYADSSAYFRSILLSNTTFSRLQAALSHLQKLLESDCRGQLQQIETALLEARQSLVGITSSTVSAASVECVQQLKSCARLFVVQPNSAQVQSTSTEETVSTVA